MWSLFLSTLKYINWLKKDFFEIVMIFHLMTNARNVERRIIDFRELLAHLISLHIAACVGDVSIRWNLEMALTEYGITYHFSRVLSRTINLNMHSFPINFTITTPNVYTVDYSFQNLFEFHHLNQLNMTSRHTTTVHKNTWSRHTNTNVTLSLSYQYECWCERVRMCMCVCVFVRMHWLYHVFDWSLAVVKSPIPT